MASQVVIELADCLIDGNLAGGLETIHRVIGDGTEPRQFTREFVEYLRGLLLLKMGDGASLLRASVSEEILAHMQEQIARLSPRTLLRATRLFNAAALEMKAGFLPQLPLELALAETIMEDVPAAETPTERARVPEQKQPVATPSAPNLSQPSSVSAPHSAVKETRVPASPAVSAQASESATTEGTKNPNYVKLSDLGVDAAHLDPLVKLVREFGGK